MPSAIGIRVYRYDLRERGSKSRLSFTSGQLARHPREFIEDFCNRNRNSNQDKQAERSWYFEKRPSNNHFNIRGYVHYGTFGFESRFVDADTKAKKYDRKVNDVEEIPLYFDFWTPDNARFGLVAFQSFQGRSCIGMVMNKIKENFERESPGISFIFSKLMPSDVKGSALYSAPIKRLRLIKRKRSIDPADAYLGNSPVETIDMELILSARRKHDLGKLGTIRSKMPSAVDGVIEYEGIEFEEAIAEVKFGDTIRKVGVFGHNSDAGVIDLTNVIERGVDGHPTFESIKNETNVILQDFYRVLKGG